MGYFKPTIVKHQRGEQKYIRAIDRKKLLKKEYEDRAGPLTEYYGTLAKAKKLKIPVFNSKGHYIYLPKN